MKAVKILFKFTFKDSSTMKVAYLASEPLNVSDECVICQAWQNMAAEEFSRNLITKTINIEAEKIEFV